MLDFYNELKKYKKATEPKELKSIIDDKRYDFVDVVTELIMENKMPKGSN